MRVRHRAEPRSQGLDCVGEGLNPFTQAPSWISLDEQGRALFLSKVCYEPVPEPLPTPRWVDCTAHIVIVESNALGLPAQLMHAPAGDDQRFDVLQRYGTRYRFVNERLWRLNFGAVEAFRVERQED